MHKDHIAVVVPDFDPAVGGRESWVFEFSAELIRSGFRVTVLCERGGPHGMDLVIQHYASSRSPLRRARSVERQLQDLAPDAVYDVGIGVSGDVLHLHTGSEVESEVLSVAAGPWPTRLRVAVVPITRVRWAMARRLERMQVENFRHVVAISSLVAKQLERIHGPLPRRMVHIPNGIDLSKYAGEKREGTSPASQAVGDSHDLAILAVGHNHFLKGFDVVVEAMAQLREKGVGARLIVAGGAKDGPLAALARRRGVADRVTLLGPVDDVADLYRGAHVMVHPTRWDACGLVVLEAMAAGLPVVTTKYAGAAENIVSDKTGFVLDSSDELEVLVDHLLLLREPEKRREIGEAAARAAARFDVGSNYAAVIDLLGAAVETNRNARR